MRGLRSSGQWRAVGPMMHGCCRYSHLQICTTFFLCSACRSSYLDEYSSSLDEVDSLTLEMRIMQALSSSSDNTATNTPLPPHDKKPKKNKKPKTSKKPKKPPPHPKRPTSPLPPPRQPPPPPPPPVVEAPPSPPTTQILTLVFNFTLAEEQIAMSANATWRISFLSFVKQSLALALQVRASKNLNHPGKHNTTVLRLPSKPSVHPRSSNTLACTTLLKSVVFVQWQFTCTHLISKASELAKHKMATLCSSSVHTAC